MLDETDDRWSSLQVLSQGATFGVENLYGAGRCRLSLIGSHVPCLLVSADLTNNTQTGSYCITDMSITHMLLISDDNNNYQFNCFLQTTFHVFVFPKPISCPAVPSPHTYRAVGHVTLVSLTKEKLDAILKHFPSISKIPADVEEQEATPSEHCGRAVGSDVRMEKVLEIWDVS